MDRNLKLETSLGFALLLKTCPYILDVTFCYKRLIMISGVFLLYLSLVKKLIFEKSLDLIVLTDLIF